MFAFFVKKLKQKQMAGGSQKEKYKLNLKIWKMDTAFFVVVFLMGINYVFTTLNIYFNQQNSPAL